MKISALSCLVLLLPATALANPGDAAWRKQIEADVNGQGVVVSSGDAAEEGQTAQERLTKSCGRGMKVLFDWSAFKPEDWVAEGGTDHLADLPGVCMGEWVNDLRAMCENPQDREFRKPLDAIKTVTCRPKPCKELPRMEYGYALTGNGTNFDVGFCMNTSVDASDNAIHAAKALRDSLLVQTPQGPMRAKELNWRRKTEDRANDVEDAYGQDVGTQSATFHDRIKSECKQDVKVLFDWKSYKMDEWWVAGNQQRHDQWAEWNCTPVLGSLAGLCEHPVAGRKPLAVQTITCHASPCDKLPQKNDAGDKYATYAFKLNGTNLDVSTCPDTKGADEALRAFVTGAKP